MGSLSRRLAKATRGMRKGFKRGARAGRAVGLSAAMGNVRHAEGMRLSERLEKAANDVGEKDALKFLEYLRKMRRGYDPKKDGPSQLMKLVDEINTFEREELSRRKAEAEATRQ